MTKSNDFGILLTDAIYRISSCEADKPLSVVHDEVGYALGREGGSAIYYWRRGNVPKLGDVEKMANVIIQRSDLGKEWLQSFLESAEHPYSSGLCDELFPDQPSISSVSVEITEEGMDRETGHQASQTSKTRRPSNGLPRKMYSQFVGRAHLVDEVMAALADPNGHWVVSIDGIGGIGKTALAYEVAATTIRKQLFDQVVWVDAGIELDRTDGSRISSFEDVLNCVACQLGEPATTQLPLPEKKARIRSLLDIQRVLIVVDTLEDAGESQENISHKLDPLLGTSKALLVSRYRFRGNAYTIHLRGLHVDNAIKFIRQEAKKRRLRGVEAAKEEELESISDATGGSPLAMKLILGQLEYLPIDIVLKHLCQAEPLNDDRERDEYIHLYDTIYTPLWDRLSENGQRLLCTAIQQGDHVDISLETLRAVCTNLSDGDFTRCINELWHSSLLEISGVKSSSLGQVQYNLHALTRYFVPSAKLTQM